MTGKVFCVCINKGAWELLTWFKHYHCTFKIFCIFPLLSYTRANKILFLYCFKLFLLIHRQDLYEEIGYVSTFAGKWEWDLDLNDICCFPGNRLQKSLLWNTDVKCRSFVNTFVPITSFLVSWLWLLMPGNYYLYVC